MSDEQILKTLENIKDYCEIHKDCEGCKFKTGIMKCQINDLTDQLGYSPSMWDMGEIKEVLKRE